MQDYLTNIYLADDDPDDVLFFKYALDNLEKSLSSMSPWMALSL